MNVPNERSFQGLFKTCNVSLLSIPETEKNALKRPEPLSESYTGTPKNPEIFAKIISTAFFDPVSAALLLLETAVIPPPWVMIQLESFLTPLLATILQLKEQSNQRLPK